MSRVRAQPRTLVTKLSAEGPNTQDTRTIRAPPGGLGHGALPGELGGAVDAQGVGRVVLAVAAVAAPSKTWSVEMWISGTRRAAQARARGPGRRG